MFLWDEAKRRANLRKHGIDFVDAERIFRGFTLPLNTCAKCTETDAS